jgi:protein phosphatase
LWFEFASAQIQGKRSAQEDAIEVSLPGAAREGAPGCAERLVVAMADGMGGHVGGRIAASIVSKRFIETVGDGESWSEAAVLALSHANLALRAATEKRPDLDGMGSTLVGLTASTDGIAWISVGDTGLFHLSADGFARLNEDHSFGAYLDEQAARGLITHEAASADRRRNQLFHALLGDPIDHFEHRGQRLGLRPGDMILMATDGLKTLDDGAVGAFLAAHRDLPAVDLVRALLDAVEAADRPRQDNTTLFLVRVHDGAVPDAPSISRMVGPFLRGLREPDTTLEIPPPEGDHATRFIGPASQSGRRDAWTGGGADLVGGAGAGDGLGRVVADPAVDPALDPGCEALTGARGLAMLAAVGLVCAGLIGLLWYVLSR